MKAKKNAAAEMTHTAAETTAAVIADAKDKLGPLAKDARDKGAVYAQQAADALAPTIAVAKGRAREQYEELVPKLSDALENLVTHPNAQEAQIRGLAAVQALKGELTPSKADRKKLQQVQLDQINALRKSAAPVKAKKKKGRTFFMLLALGALGGVGYFLWKKFMAPSDSDWQSATAYEPVRPAPQPTATKPSAAKPAAASQSFGEPVNAPATEESAPSVDRIKYGKDAYVGAEPPVGYTIKGNERSMKYHTAGSGGYERTIADVWFTSEEAAEKAGFSRAQR